MDKNFYRITFVFAFLVALNPTDFRAQITFTNSAEVLTTQDVFSSHPIGITDLNGDGLDDIMRLDGGNDLYVNYQNNDGSFTEYHYGEVETGGGWGGDAWGLCIGDLDNNGRLDLLCGGSYDDLKIVLAGADDGVFTTSEIDAEGIFLQGVNFFDIDKDGDLDVFACHDDGPSQLLMNDGSGNFQEGMLDGIFNTSLYASEEDNSGNYGSVWSDVNGDKQADCYIAKCRQGVTDNTDVRRINQLWMHQSNETYEEMGEESGTNSGWQSWSADFGDIDNDGDMDLFVGNHDYTNQFFENLGNGIFQEISDASGIEDVFTSIVIQSIFRDFDNDGWIDLLISGGNEYTIARNNGDKTFTAVNEFLSGFGLNSFACGDLNNDGAVDIYGTTGGYGAWGGDEEADGVFINTSNNGNNWVKVKLESTVSAPDGVGAIVVVENDGVTQMREIRSGESYGIQNSMIAHFGLGQSEMVYPTITVYWPSGIVDQLVGTSYNTNSVIEGTFQVNIPKAPEQSLSIYPNPATTSVKIEGDIRSIQLVNSVGETVFNKATSDAMYMLPVRTLSPGTYQLVITNSQGSTSSQRLVIQ